MAAYNHYQPLAETTWSIKHSLNTKMIAIDVMELTGNGVYEKIMPQQVRILDDNNVSVIFPTDSPKSGRARIVSRMG